MKGRTRNSREKTSGFFIVAWIITMIVQNMVRWFTFLAASSSPTAAAAATAVIIFLVSVHLVTRGREPSCQS